MALSDSIEFEYKLVTPENLERFSEMAAICLGLNADSNYYQWKYLHNPAGKVIAFEATHNGRPAAFYGVIPEFYYINGQQVKIYQSMDTMTHPDYQKRGLFVKLANMTYDYVAKTEQRCDLVGIPGGNSFYGFVHKLNWKNIHNFSYFFLPRSWFRARNLIKRSSPAEFKPVAKMSAELSQYLNDHEPSPKRISNLMSPEFFQWRVFQNPIKGFKVVEVFVGGSLIGVCVYTLEAKGRCLVHLLDFLEQSYYDKYVGAVLNCLFMEGPRFIYTWEPLNETIHRAYQKCGFIRNRLEKGPFSYRVPLIVRSLGTEVNGVNWFDIKNFDFQPIMQD